VVQQPLAGTMQGETAMRFGAGIIIGTIIGVIIVIWLLVQIIQGIL
jgi:hypothetical protein